jgi:hypothetical protein
MSSIQQRQRLLSPFSRSLDSSNWPSFSLDVPPTAHRSRGRSPLAHSPVDPTASQNVEEFPSPSAAHYAQQEHHAEQDGSALVHSESEGNVGTVLFGSGSPGFFARARHSHSNTELSSYASPPPSSFLSMSATDSSVTSPEEAFSCAFSASTDDGTARSSSRANMSSASGFKYPAHLVKGGPLIKCPPTFDKVQAQHNRTRVNSADRPALGKPARPGR